MRQVINGIRRISDTTYDIYIRDQKRRNYKGHPRPGIFDLRSARWWKRGIESTRDSMRQRCYNAEHDVCPQITQPTFKTAHSVAIFFRNIMESDWFQRRFPHFFYLRISRKVGGRKASACPTEKAYNYRFKDMSEAEDHVTRGWIGFSTWAMGISGQHGGELIMLHELAHAILPAPRKGKAWHGRRWARVFLELVKHYIDRETYEKLKLAFKTRKVKVNPVRIVSDKQRMTLAACSRLPKKTKIAGLPAPADLISASSESPL